MTISEHLEKAGHMVQCPGQQIQDDDAGGQVVVDGKKRCTITTELADEQVAGLNGGTGGGGDVCGGLGLAR